MGVDLEHLLKTGVGIHSPDDCAGEPCPFHNPSDHHMKDWPKSVRHDRGCLVERHCPDNGIGHPDPDSVAWLVRTTGQDHWGIHGCDGCCTPPGPKFRSVVHPTNPNLDAWEAA